MKSLFLLSVKIVIVFIVLCALPFDAFSDEIIDNDDANFTAVGNWTSSTTVAGYYGADYLYAFAGDGSGTATWAFDVINPGQYEVYAQWTEHAARAPEARYRIYNNGFELGLVLKDQRVDGGQFNLLGSYSAGAGTLEVVLTDEASDFVIADAVQIVYVGGPGNMAPNGTIDSPVSNMTINVGDTVDFSGTGSDPDNDLPLSFLWDFGDATIPDAVLEDPGFIQFDNPGTFQVTFTVTDALGLADPTPAQVIIEVLSGDITIIDNDDAGFTAVGNWTSSTFVAGYYGADYLYAYAGDGSGTATWAFDVINPGQYEVYAQWTEHAARAPEARYRIYNNGFELGLVLKDQRVDGGQFNLLGSYSAGAGTLEVVLTDEASDFVIADAVQIVYVGGPGNMAPNGTIDSPVSNITINVGDTVDFSGTGSDPDNDLPLSFLWDFGDATIPDAVLEDPGFIQFDNPGTFQVTFTVTDALGLADPTPAQVSIEVLSGNMAPNGTIDSPVSNMTINVGDTVDFSGTGSDPDNDLPLSFLWDFGDATIPDAVLADPGFIQFDNPGTFQVTFTVTDALGLADPTPAQVSIEVLSGNMAPNGTIDSPVSNMTINVGDTVDFSGTGSDPDNDLPLSFLWDFGDGAIPDVVLEDPGLVQFNNPGTFQMTFTVTDALGLADPTPAQVSIEVLSGNLAPDGTIESPVSDTTINMGDTIDFTGTGSDPDNDLPLSFLWDFGDGAIPDAVLEDPGLVQFNNPGTFQATFTVTDALGLADPTPAQVIIEVLSGDITIIDNDDAGFTAVGNWTSSTFVAGYYGANYLYARAGNGSGTATWTFDVIDPGQYDVYAQWTEHARRAPDALYRIYNNGFELGSVVKDQQVDGGQFNFLGSFTVTNGTLEVVLTDEASDVIVADAVQIVYTGSEPLIEILSPANLEFKSSQDHTATARSVGFPFNWYLKFILDGDLENAIEGNNCDPHFEGLSCLNYTNLSKANHTIQACMVDENGDPQQFSEVINFVIGDYYVALGDSITWGFSAGGGFVPILNNLLTISEGYPHTVENEGVGGDASIDGLARINQVLAAYPESQYILILFGTNDSHNTQVDSGLDANGELLNPGDPGYADSFLDNMEQIINEVIADGKMPYLAKVPITLGPCSNCSPFPDPDTAPRNLLIQEYNLVIDALVAAYGIGIIPPDFYEHFRANQNEFADNLHLNSQGYNSMANLWHSALTQ